MIFMLKPQNYKLISGERKNTITILKMLYFYLTISHLLFQSYNFNIEYNFTCILYHFEAQQDLY